jgi:nitric oxide reductase subunit B
MIIPKYVKVILLSGLLAVFAVLVAGGILIDNEKPPIPSSVVTEKGDVLFTGEDIMKGQQIYFARGGQHIGTIWGHGSYLAPDWSADYLHRLAVYAAGKFNGLKGADALAFNQKQLDAIDGPARAALTERVKAELRKNRYDAAAQKLSYTDIQVEGFKMLQKYYTALFNKGNDKIGVPANTVRDEKEGYYLSTFFSWLSWAAVTKRPGKDVTYTTNWPYDPLVGNTPEPTMLLWSIISVVLLVLFVGIVLFVYNRLNIKDDYDIKPVIDIDEPAPTASQKATLIFFVTAMALFVLQVLFGSLNGHYTVEGGYFGGFNIEKILPYPLLRTWHLQLAVYWIATCFLASGLFIAPSVGKEPKFQSKVVYMLFGAIVVVVVGSLTGNWFSVQGFFSSTLDAFNYGHQGYEYIELGRLWQVLLIAGMIVWLGLVYTALKPALKAEKDKGGITHLFLYSSITIPLFYMAGLMYGHKTHVSNAEYWRWWVVHLWVEGFFEVFATITLGFILTRIKAVTERTALITIYLGLGLYLGAGVIGTFHHLYWSGSPIPIIALGAVFSALEIVPLTLLGFEAASTVGILKHGGGKYAYKWPLMFFLAVAFWNLIGAGVFGFLINPPIVLYYIQGLNMTPLHGHTALFGVYGFLGIALMLFSLRHIVVKRAWSDSLLKWSFWLLNIGLIGMTVLSLLPAGIYQFIIGVKHGMWFARSPEVTTSEFIKTTSYLRIGPDLIFAAGAVLILAFVLRAAIIPVIDKKKQS